MELVQNVLFLRNGSSTSFEAQNGLEPYVYSVEPDGAGGTIDSNTGLYLAPTDLSVDPRLRSDSITVTDANSETVTSIINILSAEEIIADIISKGLDLGAGQVIMQNQKFKVPNDEKIYVAITLLDGKPYSNNKTHGEDLTGFYSLQTMRIRDMVNINIMSSSMVALLKRHEVMMALNSDYGSNMQNQNGMSISKIPLSITNLSEIEGARIPYGFNITVALQYGVCKKTYVEYFDTFSQPTIEIDKVI